MRVDHSDTHRLTKDEGIIITGMAEVELFVFSSPIYINAEGCLRDEYRKQC